MAYHFFETGKSGKQFREYNIDFSVGRGGVNRPDDVMLVQICLHIAYHENADRGSQVAQVLGDLRLAGKSQQTAWLGPPHIAT
jgi:hypothetical protein